jgi:hypothetical protein
MTAARASETRSHFALNIAAQALMRWGAFGGTACWLRAGLNQDMDVQ